MVVQENIRTDIVSSPLKNDKKHRLKQRFDVRKKLGQGTYGKVQLAINRETGQEVAVKTIKKVKIENEQDLIRIRREIQIMSSIQHPHIIHIYEVFENKDKIVLVMQFASGGELYDYLSEKKVLSDSEARRIFRQIAAAVYYCHKNKICHRDLKLENILLDEKGNAKIADFGLSNVFDDRHLLKTYCGSPLYASPEIVKGVPYYGPEVDCWSMGVLLYTLVYGAMPFDGSNFKKLVTQISEGEYFEPKKKSNASELIRRLLTVDPVKRATIVDICLDCWVNLGYEHSLLQVAEDMANLTPVRLDLLLALAPGSPIPEDDSEFPEQTESEDAGLPNPALDKDILDEDEEDEDEECNADTAANSFAFVKGSRASQFSTSSPNLQEALAGAFIDEDGNEFLPAEVAAMLQSEGGKRLAESSFGASLARISSLAHRSKKPRKSDSSTLKEENVPVENSEKLKLSSTSEKVEPTEPNESKSLELSKSVENKTVSNQKEPTDAPKTDPKDAEASQNKKSDEAIVKPPVRRDSLINSKIQDITSQKRGSIAEETKKMGRPPGKIIIPKTFDSPQSTPSPKPLIIRRSSKSDAALECREVQEKVQEEAKQEEMSPVEDINKNIVGDDSVKTEPKPVEISEEKKNLAKGILKKGIAKAKLAERKMSQQSSFDSDVSTPPVSVVNTPEPAPSFFKMPKPYVKEEEKSLKSKAEIKLSNVQNSSSTIKNESVSSRNAPLWDSAAAYEPKKECSNWSEVSSNIDSEMSGWREQMEESLRRLSPDDERSTASHSYAISKPEDDKPLVPIARSYKKFTFTKDGACITETKKIYTTPGADGSWTKVEKKTKITTRPGNAEEFEKFRDLHLRNDSPLTRSDSHSSSGSNDVYDDIFDSWTGDTMMCNMRKMNNMFQKFSQDPFLRKERRRNPFRFFRRAESERNDREKTKYEIRGGRSTDQDSPENEDDYDVHFEDSNPVVYGSQGLWQFLRSANRGAPGRITIHHEPVGYDRTSRQGRPESKFDSDWKRSGSRASSGYNTGTRSQSRDRTESPREKVLRFVFESPSGGFSREAKVKESPSKHDRFSMRRNLHHPRRDSGVGSDGYESEYSVRPSPSDEFSKAGRVSSMSSICSSGRQEMIKNFMKSWSKDFVSPPLSPTSLRDSKESLSESRKHRVEQWLHMNPQSPFEAYAEAHPRKSSLKQGNSSTVYATVRPREYMQYTRSSSDKIPDYDDTDYFPSFGESCRIRSHSLNKEDSIDEINKLRFRSSAYSPVSEETRSAYHSDSSHSPSSVHRINFTFSDGRAMSSHSSPQSSARFTRTFSTSKDGHVIVESPPVQFEQVSSRNAGQPMVQMRVSFNRGNRENQVIHVTSQSSQQAGLWEQQEPPKSFQEFPSNSARSASPLPGIRQFSTEVQHKVGETDKVPCASVECEVTSTGKESPSQTGKSIPFKPNLPLESSIWDMACSQACMENAAEFTNINDHRVSPVESHNFSSESRRPKSLFPLQNGCSMNRSLQPHVPLSNGANTPDSLEDLSLEQSLSECSNSAENELSESKTYSITDSPVDADASGELNVEIKPLGVLWNNCPPEDASEAKPPEKGKLMTFADVQNVPANVRIIEDPKMHEKNSDAEFGSIWNQKSATQTFDLLKNLLSDDGLESFNSAKCVLDASETKMNKNNAHYFVNKNMKPSERQPVIEKHIAVIDNIELDQTPRHDKFHRIMPSLMDDLQSPKEVLRQAMKICESLELKN